MWVNIPLCQSEEKTATYTHIHTHTERKQAAERGDKGREGGLGDTQIMGGTKGGNERESRDGESKIEYRESGEVKARRRGREKRTGRENYKWRATLESLQSAIWARGR